MNIKDILDNIQQYNEKAYNVEYNKNEIYYYRELDSTNIKAKEMANYYPEGTIVIAGKQTKGKGRKGRAWTAETGEGLLYSVILKPTLRPEYMGMITIIAAIAVLDALKENTGLDLSIKWPNDILVGNKKISGILAESIADSSGNISVILGIGININNKAFPDELINRATSVKIEGVEASMSQIFMDCIDNIFELYNNLQEKDNLSFIIDKYNENLKHYDEEIEIEEDGDIKKIWSYGINKKGQLEIIDNKIKREIFSGEISVKGVYGGNDGK